MPQMSGSAFFVTFRSRPAKYRPRLTPVIPAAHVITPKMRLTLTHSKHNVYSTQSINNFIQCHKQIRAAWQKASLTTAMHGLTKMQIYFTKTV